MTKDSLFFVEQQTSIRSMVVVCGPAASGGADAFWLRGACVVAAARGADPVGAAVLAEMNDGHEQCLGRRQLLLQSGAATLLDGQCDWIAPRRRPLRSSRNA